MQVDFDNFRSDDQWKANPAESIGLAYGWVIARLVFRIGHARCVTF
jgi:hypothetical protein